MPEDKEPYDDDNPDDDSGADLLIMQFCWPWVLALFVAGAVKRLGLLDPTLLITTLTQLTLALME